MIHKIEKISVTENSYPFARAAEKCGFAERGFTEEEYFLYGTANVYETRNRQVAIAFPDAPYVNRILVRRPEHAEQFSGRCVVEIINSTSGFDVDRMWVLAREKFMRDGDMYIGITSKASMIPVLQKFDPERYQELHWRNPRPATLPAMELGNVRGASSPETEDGLIWDMLTDLSKILRDSDRTPVSGFDITHLYLTGWSQSGGYLLRFVNTFAYRKTYAVPLYDGYLAGGSGGVGYPGLNQEESMYTGLEEGVVPWKLGSHTEPYIDVHTESDNTGLGTLEARIPDSDEPDGPYRCYDIPGASHDTYDTMISYYQNDPDLFRTGLFPAYQGREPLANDFPYELIFHRAFAILFDWVEKGRKPMRLPLIQLDAFTKNNSVDEYGNAIGGWRSAFVDLPVCTYRRVSTPLNPSCAFGCGLFGHVIPFSPDRLKELYGSLNHYLELVQKRAEQDVAEGLLCQEDETTYVRLAVERAQKYGLG